MQKLGEKLLHAEAQAELVEGLSGALTLFTILSSFSFQNLMQDRCSTVFVE